jgi:RimJ/RimL family protein N-acetyltransferase
VIEAGAFTLRLWEAADTSFVFDAAQDGEVRRWSSLPSPFTAGDAARFVREHARNQPEGVSAWFAITLTESGELLGSVGFSELDLASGTGEISYWLAPEGRGRGAATAGLTALCRWGFDALGLVEVQVRIAAGNLASRRVAERAGFERADVQVGVCHDGDDPADAVIYRLRSAGQ